MGDISFVDITNAPIYVNSSGCNTRDIRWSVLVIMIGTDDAVLNLRPQTTSNHHMYQFDIVNGRIIFKLYSFASMQLLAHASSREIPSAV